MALEAFEGHSPHLHPSCFVAGSAQLVGQVYMAQGSSARYKSVLKAHINTIHIGAYSQVQEHCSLHVTEQNPCLVGDYVTLAHGVTLEGCHIGQACLIGIGAVIAQGARVGHGSIIAAHAYVEPHEHIPPHSLVVGNPARVVKALAPELEAAHIHQSLRYAQQAQVLKAQKN